MTREKREKEPCEDCISRQAVEDAMYDATRSLDLNYEQIMEYIDKIPSVKQKPKTGQCKNCKHFWCIEDCEPVTLCNKHTGMKVSKNFYCKDFEMSEVSK